MNEKIKQPLIKRFWKSGGGWPPRSGLKAMFLPLFLIICLLPAAAPGAARGSDTDFKGIKEKMRVLYQDGKLEEFIGLYKKACLKEGEEKEKKEFKKADGEIRAQVYRWVYLSYRAMDMPVEADRILRKLLGMRHRKGMDQSGLVFIKRADRGKYHVAPRFLVGLKTGTNFTVMHPARRYMADGPVEPGDMHAFRKDYGLHFTHSRGKTTGIILEYALTKNFSITIQPAVSTLKFQYKNTLIQEVQDGVPVNVDYTHHHKLGYIEVPVLLIYRRAAGKLKPYVQVGGYYNILTSGEKLLRWFGSPDQEYEAEAIVDIKKQFKTSDTGLWLGAGLGYELSGGLRLQVELNYRHGLNNIVDKIRRYENKELLFSYYDVFDDMKIRNWDLSVKIVLPLSYKAFKK